MNERKPKQFHVSATWVRRHWGDRVFERARRADLIVTRYGKPHLVILSAPRFSILIDQLMQEASDASKPVRLRIRLPAREKDLIARAAELQGLSLEQFALIAAVQRAREVLRANVAGSAPRPAG